MDARPFTGTTRPVIGMLIGRSPSERYSVHRGYVDAVAAAGGLAILVPAGAGVDPAETAEWVRGCAAVIITGGGDISPTLYGRPEDIALMDVDLDRDRVEIDVVREASGAGLRVLGICRGAQLLAVATGGSLITDVTAAGFGDHWGEARQYEPVHGIKVEAGSLAEIALGSSDVVNSIHHQAVADPGPLLTATAWAPDGLIEAVEGQGMLGVQWHPERLAATDARHLAPFVWAVHG